MFIREFGFRHYRKQLINEAPMNVKCSRVLDQLRMYEALIAESERPILHDKPLLEPLFSLLSSYQGAPPHGETDQVVSQLCQSLCLWIGRDPSLLPVFFSCGQNDQGGYFKNMHP